MNFKAILIILILLLIVFIFIVFGVKKQNPKIENSANPSNGANNVVPNGMDTGNKTMEYLSDDGKIKYGIETKEKVPVEAVAGGENSIGPLPKIYLPKEYASEQLPVIDTDGDGITDKDEAKYKTNSSLADTDNDGLNDGEEIFKYHTDPNNPDTDGDGYKDGEEVKNSYNPLGEGKLRQ